MHTLDAEHSNFAVATDLNNFSHRCPYLYPRTQKASVLGIRELNKRLGQVIKRTICCGLPSYFLKSELIALLMKQLQKVRRDGTWGKSDVRGKERPIRNESVALLVNKISVHIRWTVRWCLKRLKKERRLFLLVPIFLGNCALMISNMVDRTEQNRFIMHYLKRLQQRLL